jgi:hypothetical protein
VKQQRLGGVNSHRPRGLAGLPALVGIWLLALAAAPPAHARDATIQGTLTYDKVPATAQGLQLSAIERRPCAGVVVDLVAVKSGIEAIGRAVTDDSGFYRITVALSGPTSVYLLIRAQADNAAVRDPTTNGLFVVATADFSLSPGGLASSSFNIPDSSRLSGPFNILAVIAAANKRVRAALPGVVLPPLTVLWSTTFRGGGDFMPPNTIALNGDRSVNSDEYDDSVIAHELGHFFQFALSRDDSFGGEHAVGDRLDPATAFSEGWATGSGQTLLNTATYIDTFGNNGAQAFVVDIEPDAPFYDPSGYWSDLTIASTFWDLAKTSTGDPAIFKALVALAKDPITYFIAYCDDLVSDNRDRAGVVDALTSILTAHLIDYKADVVPSVANPFPTPLVSGQPLTGTLNSTVPVGRADRFNLYDARSVSTFTLASPAIVDLVLQIVSSKTPNTADLDLVLFDANDNPIGFSAATNGIGGREQINTSLPAGTYRVEIWSSWEDTSWHYNSADFALTLTTS